MYSVVGPDGKTYGPVDSATIRTWCQEGRITAETSVIDPIDGQTKRAAAIPEIAQYIPAAGTRFATPPSPGFGTPPGFNYNYNQQPMAYGYSPVASPPKSKVAAILLAFFLGTLGIHRFYMGHTVTGVVMLLITVLTLGFGTIITWPWSIVDMILIATGGLRDSNNVPLV